MGDRYICPACGANTDDRSNHESWCPGSLADRVAALEEEVRELRAIVTPLDPGGLSRPNESEEK